MMRFLRRRLNADTLTWEYLDGEITPSRAQVLSNMLLEKAEARQRFVEAAVMHGMLFDYFKKQAEMKQDEHDADGMPKRRKPGRTSAA
ncbi:MAG: hypothetical protein ACPGYV_06710 [Phycisphaeraceae bacterium]